MPASVPNTFRAYQYAQFGPLDKTLKLNGNVKQQPLAPSQVRLEVKAAAINPADYILVEQGDKFLNGQAPPTTETPFGFGFDVAGTIVEVGSNVKGFKIGDDVFAMTPWNAFGSIAEYMVIDASVLAHKPANVSFEQAGGAPLAVLTSHQALFQHAKLEAGETVLVLGGSSSTGAFAIQLAKSVGATIITTASAANTEFVKSLGADVVIDYKSEKWVDVLEQHSVDVLYDCGVEADAWNTGAQKVLKVNSGRYVTLWPEPEPVREAEFGAINVGHIVVQPSGEQLEKVAVLMSSDQVKTPVDSVVDLEELSSGIARVQSRRARGKVVVSIGKATP